MRFSDIKVGYIYNLIFDPVRECEFAGKHLAVVLKRNNDKTTFIVMPLTTSSNGVGVNKMKLGKINSLPSSIKSNDTYAVYNQVRTVNVDRFIALKEGSSIKECQMEKHIFHELLFLGLREIVYSIPQDEKIDILKRTYESELISKAKDIAYQVVKLRKEGTPNQEQIDELLVKIKKNIKDISYTLDKQFTKDGIDTIFEEAKNL